MVSSSCWCKGSFSWEPTAGEAGEPDFVVLSRKWANGGMGWMLIATVWIGSFPHSLLTRKKIAWKAENWEAWSATYDFSSLKPVLSFTTSRGSRNDMAKEKTQTAALGVQTYMFATPIRACFLQPSNYIIHIIHLILYIPVYPKHVRGGSRCFKTRWWLHKRRKTSATTGLPKPRTCCLCLNSSISWYRHESKGCTLRHSLGVHPSY